MVILAALIYLLNVWLQDGDDIVSGLLLSCTGMWVNYSLYGGIRWR